MNDLSHVFASIARALVGEDIPWVARSMSMCHHVLDRQRVVVGSTAGGDSLWEATTSTSYEMKRARLGPGHGLGSRDVPFARGSWIELAPEGRSRPWVQKAVAVVVAHVVVAHAFAVVDAPLVAVAENEAAVSSPVAPAILVPGAPAPVGGDGVGARDASVLVVPQAKEMKGCHA